MAEVLFDAVFLFFFKQKTAYELRISDWSSDVCSSDLLPSQGRERELAASAAPTRACKKKRPVFTGPPVVADARRQTRLPRSSDTTARTRKQTNRTQAMLRAAPAIPENRSTRAWMASPNKRKDERGAGGGEGGRQG